MYLAVKSTLNRHQDKKNHDINVTHNLKSICFMNAVISTDCFQVIDENAHSK